MILCNPQPIGGGGGELLKPASTISGGYGRLLVSQEKVKAASLKIGRNLKVGLSMVFTISVSLFRNICCLECVHSSLLILAIHDMNCSDVLCQL